jgi:hypothetical protein
MRFKEYITEAGGDANLLETESLLGVTATDRWIELCQMITSGSINEEELIEWHTSIKDQFGSGRDWIQSSVEKIKNIKITDTKIISELAMNAIGMRSFVNYIGLTNANFIHNNIKSYYKVENDIMGTNTKSKDNTADVIIMSASSHTKFLSEMAKGEIEIDEVGGSIKFGQYTAYQVSLKKSKDGAQIGKIGGYLRSILDVEGASDAAKEMANEGIVSNIKSFIKGTWEKLKNKFDVISKKIISGIKSFFNVGVTRKDLEEIAKMVEFKGNISENSVSYFNNYLTEEMNQETKDLLDAIINKKDKILKNINKNFNTCVGLSNKLGNVKSHYKQISNISKIDRQDALKLVSNYSNSKVIIKLIKGLESYSVTIKQLVGEMFFGDTKLPLWKVYGSSTLGGKSYEYLGTIETFTKEGDSQDLDIFAYTLYPSKSNNYYMIKMYTLKDFTVDEKTYVVLRVDTNSSSRFSSNIEGVKEIKMPINENIESHIRGN